MSSNLFKGRHFESDTILLCVRWHLKYPLSYRNLVEMIGGCGQSPVLHQSSERGPPPLIHSSFLVSLVRATIYDSTKPGRSTSAQWLDYLHIIEVSLGR